jgi:uncharacterized protein YggU (UPF0235/DUF167 family)
VAEARVLLRVRPGASRTAVGGCYPGPRGPALVVAVTARAVDGRATEAALRAVAAALGVRPAAVALVSGGTSRDKIVAVDPAPADLADRLAALRDGKPGFGDEG